MRFTVATAGRGSQRTECLVIGRYEDETRGPVKGLDDDTLRVLDPILQRGDFRGTCGATLLVGNAPGAAVERVLLVGLGREDEWSETRYRTAMIAAAKALSTTGVTQATLALDALALASRGDDWKIEQAVLALMDGLYRFDQLKTRPTEPKAALDHVSFRVENASGAEAIVARAVATAEGITLAKDLGNLPGNICTPTYLAEQAREIGKGHGIDVTVLERGDVEKLGMGAFLAVARGSLQPPKLIVMEYRGGGREARPVVLVGKGITFDAGGISIKPAHEMDEMKFDMCGAASVFGALRAAALMKLPLNVVGIVPATENMPGGNAIKPGDVVTTMSGQTVEILDTDSEGRLVLCDALTYAECFNPAAVVDVATLTGEIVVSLGHLATGLFANDDSLAREIVEAGDASWDRVWRMPLWDDYQDALKSNFADLPNVGSHPADAITAACFLSRFTRRYPWAHLDIAGTASRSGEDKGATGRPVGLLAHFLARRAAL